MTGTMILRILRMAGQNIYRNGLTSIVAVLVITLLFVLFNGILFANAFQRTALELVNERLDLAINFVKPVDEFQINIIVDELNTNFPEIRSVGFISREQAFQNFLKNFGQANRRLATWLQANTEKSPLPATLVISADAELHAEIVRYLDSSNFSDLFNLDTPATGKLATETANKIIALDKTLSRISFLTTIIFSLLAILIIVAVLRLAIFARGAEIGIMRLVGATRAFIRLPFILEGVFFGVSASFLGALIFYGTIANFDATALTGGPYGSFGEMVDLTIQNLTGSFALTLSWQIFAAIMIGTLASVIATYRYLRSKELILH
ncbi:MAG: permease-like cell division protein FtsX [Patescibacteria group bacterium]